MVVLDVETHLSFHLPSLSQVLPARVARRAVAFQHGEDPLLEGVAYWDRKRPSGTRPLVLTDLSRFLPSRSSLLALSEKRHLNDSLIAPCWSRAYQASSFLEPTAPSSTLPSKSLPTMVPTQC